ncbi:unnamed protein product [Vitrella brassicaformis CCMP3155]|uniref:Uncharacterized protein n=2 Tax=Vitrella brassicaformis TaxID=1169539 RepID=A0A0G4GE28_VITBC|nr:unnamed protein product [Vitrella brassicaformis CCMP3155]|eukprot:CEM27653.1 unnamed protein product [Vitrella brassicaformis CCMP3155]
MAAVRVTFLLAACLTVAAQQSGSGLDPSFSYFNLDGSEYRPAAKDTATEGSTGSTAQTSGSNVRAAGDNDDDDEALLNRLAETLQKEADCDADKKADAGGCKKIISGNPVLNGQNGDILAEGNLLVQGGALIDDGVTTTELVALRECHCGDETVSRRVVAGAFEVRGSDRLADGEQVPSSMAEWSNTDRSAAYQAFRQLRVLSDGDARLGLAAAQVQKVFPSAVKTFVSRASDEQGGDAQKGEGPAGQLTIDMTQLLYTQMAVTQDLIDDYIDEKERLNKTNKGMAKNIDSLTGTMADVNDTLERLRKANETVMDRITRLEQDSGADEQRPLGPIEALRKVAVGQDQAKTIEGLKKANGELRTANEDMNKAMDGLRKANEAMLDRIARLEEGATAGDESSGRIDFVKMAAAQDDIKADKNQAETIEGLKKANEELRTGNQSMKKTIEELLGRVGRLEQSFEKLLQGLMAPSRRSAGNAPAVPGRRGGAIQKIVEGLMAP